MMESPGRFEQKAKQPLAPVNPVVKKNLQIVPSIRNGSQANQLSLSEGIRNFSGIVNEARNLARSLSR